MWLSWQQGAALAVGAAAAAAALRRRTGNRSGQAAAFAAEIALVATLYSLWQLIGALPTRTVPAASRHGLWIWHLEQRLHLPSELTMQRLIIHHPLWVELSNGLYAVVHVPALGVFLVWLFVRHRQRYRLYRNALAALTFLCLASHLYPVAPPRLLAGVGFVDTGLRYHQSVYGSLNAVGISDQVSAMPSLHIAWALLIAVAVISASASRWRWLIVVHPVLTTVVVVVTANHFWLDGVVAGALLVVSLIAVTGLRPLAGHHHEPEPAAAATPLPALEPA